MTADKLLTTCRQAGIILAAAGDNLDVDAPKGAITQEIRAALLAQKPELLAVLSRLQCMRATVGQVPIPCAVLAAVGGPGRCFSCGDGLGHPHAYGRCTPCSIAAELFYREVPDAAGRWRAPEVKVA